MAWQARFRSMDEGDRDEWMRVLDREHATQWGEVADGTIALLESMKDADPLGYPVNVYGHSLQSATRALRDGASEEMIVVALFHDIGNLLAPHDHGAMSALVMAPYVSEESIWLLRHHATFQQYYYMGQLGLNRDGREKFRGHPAFDMTERFCERWDQAAFDAHYDVLPIESFVPTVHRVMGAPVRGAAEAAHLAMTL